MNEQAIRFRIGLFVLASLILLAVLITLFGGFPGYFRPANKYTVLFQNAPGVAPGTPVKRSGVRVGEVRRVKLDNATGNVEVEIQIDSDYLVRKNDKPTLQSNLFGGETSIALYPPGPEEPKGDPRPVDPGSTLIGFSQADTGTLLQKAGDIVQPTQEAMEQMKKFFQTMDKMTPLLEDTLKDFREVAKATRDLVPEVREVFKQTRETIPEFREVAKATREAIPEFRDMAKAGKEAIPEFRDVAKGLKEAIPEFRKTNLEIQELVKTTQAAIPDLQKELKRTTQEFELTARTWGKVGERVDLMLQTNEKKISDAIDELQKTFTNVNRVFSDENVRYLNETLKNVRNGSTYIDGIAKNTEELVKDSRITLRRVNDSLTKVDDVLGNMQKLTTPLAQRGDSVLRNLDEVTDKLNRMLGDFRDVFGTLVRSDGTVQKLLSDPALYNNLNDSLLVINKAMPRIDRILRDVEIFADKIARHPEALGVGGALRPGTGLKEAPSPPVKMMPIHP